MDNGDRVKANTQTWPIPSWGRQSGERGVNEVNTQRENIKTMCNKCYQVRKWSVVGRNNAGFLQRGWSGEDLLGKTRYTGDRRKNRN